MNHSSKNRLTEKELFLFPNNTLFDKIGRAVCRVGCLPRKELFESWEFARRVRRRFRGGRIVDLASGHGLTASLLLLLDNSSPQALAVDRVIPASACRLHAVLVDVWPRLADRVHFIESPVEEIALESGALVVFLNACGHLNELVIDRAATAGMHLAVLPCCHHLDNDDAGGLEGWHDGPLAVDVTRAAKLRSRNYRILRNIFHITLRPKIVF